jgi:hypothetical protein
LKQSPHTAFIFRVKTPIQEQTTAFSQLDSLLQDMGGAFKDRESAAEFAVIDYSNGQKPDFLFISVLLDSGKNQLID